MRPRGWYRAQHDGVSVHFAGRVAARNRLGVLPDVEGVLWSLFKRSSIRRPRFKALGVASYVNYLMLGGTYSPSLRLTSDCLELFS